MGNMRTWALFCIFENRLLINPKMTMENTKCYGCVTDISPMYQMSCVNCYKIVYRYCFNSRRTVRNWEGPRTHIMPYGRCPQCNVWTEYVDDGAGYIQHRKPVFGFYRTKKYPDGYSIDDMDHWNNKCLIAGAPHLKIQQLMPPLVPRNCITYVTAKEALTAFAKHDDNKDYCVVKEIKNPLATNAAT